MSHKTPLLGRLAGILLVFVFPRAVQAGVLVVGPQVHRPVSMIVGIDDGPDPFGSLAWQSYNLPGDVLNADGFTRGDFAPDLSLLPIDGNPLAVWSYDSEFDHDIAFSEWTSAGWGYLQFLDAGPGDDLDPRSFVEPDGTVNVVWWRRGPPDKVIWIRRLAGSATWGAEQDITPPGSSCRRPSIIVVNGVVRVAFERDASAPGIAQEIVVATQLPNGTFDSTVIAQTQRTDRLDAVVHNEFGRTWAEWKIGDAVLGYSRFEGSLWTPALTLQAPSASWIGIEDARRSVRRACMAP